MSFREKSAWIRFVLLAGFGVYFAGIFNHWLNPTEPHTNYFLLFVGLVIAIVVLEIATQAFMAIRSPQEAKAPIDERERMIALHATQPAFYVLLVGAFLSIGTMHLGANTWILAHCVLLSIWIAELTRFGTQIYYFRRGA
jgi:hypothetical protein